MYDESLDSGNVFDRGANIRFLGLFDSVPGGSSPEATIKERFRLSQIEPAACVQFAVHILALDEQRSVFNPLVWQTQKSYQEASNHGLFVEQIWMPGVHTDIGGGYRNNFISNVALITMLDKLKEYCPDIKFNKKYIQKIHIETQENMSVRVHNEWAGLGKAAKVAQYILGKARKVVDIDGSRMEDYKKNKYGVYNSIHPLLFQMYGKEINYKGRQLDYRPTAIEQFDLREVFETVFSHNSKVREICRIRDYD